MKRKESDSEDLSQETISRFTQAAALDCTSFLKAWLNMGIKVDSQDVMGCTALHVALHHMRWCTVKLLLERKCNTNVADALGWTALHVVLLYVKDKSYPTKKFVELLIKYGADVNAITGKNNPEPKYRGLTPLHLACLGQDLDICKILLDFGADLGIKNAGNLLAYHEGFCGVEFSVEFKNRFRKEISEMKKQKKMTEETLKNAKRELVMDLFGSEGLHNPENEVLLEVLIKQKLEAAKRENEEQLEVVKRENAELVSHIQKLKAKCKENKDSSKAIKKNNFFP